MHEEKPTFKDLLRKHKIVLGAVAAQAGVEIRIAYKMEQGEVIHGVYADQLLAALSHLAGQKGIHTKMWVVSTCIRNITMGHTCHEQQSTRILPEYVDTVCMN